MKRTLKIIAIITTTLVTLLLTMVVGVAHAQFPRFPFEYGTYVMVSESNGREIVKRTVYFTQWGEWQVITEKLISTGIITTSREKKDSAWFSSLRRRDVMQENIDDSNQEHKRNAGTTTVPKARRDSGPLTVTVLGEENYLGFPCVITHMAYPDGREITHLRYNTTFVMRSEVVFSDGTKVTFRVVSIDLTPPPASVFEDF